MCVYVYVYVAHFVFVLSYADEYFSHILYTVIPQHMQFDLHFGFKHFVSFSYSISSPLLLPPHLFHPFVSSSSFPCLMSSSLHTQVALFWIFYPSLQHAYQMVWTAREARTVVWRWMICTAVLEYLTYSMRYVRVRAYAPSPPPLLLPQNPTSHTPYYSIHTQIWSAVLHSTLTLSMH